MKNGIAVLVLGGLLVGNAGATEELDIPAMDFQRFCETKAARFGKDQKTLDMCLREERAILDFLLKGGKKSYPNVQKCLDAAQAVGGSYTVFGLCLSEQKRQTVGENVKDEPKQDAPAEPAMLKGKPIKGAEKAFIADVMKYSFPAVAKEMGKKLSLTFTGTEPGDAFIDIYVSGPMTEPGLDQRLADLVMNGTMQTLEKWGYSPKEDETRIGCVLFCSLKSDRTRKYGTMLYDKKQGKSVWVPEDTTLPVYDIKSYCARVSNNIGGSAQMEKICRDEEKYSYLLLQNIDIPPKTLRYCDKVSSNLGGTYQMLRVCVEQEIEALKSLEK